MSLKVGALKQNYLYSISELRKDICTFVDFLRNNKLTVVLCWFFILFSYGIKLFWYSISIDTECIINNYEGLKIGWFAINRSGLILTKEILKLIPFNPYVANFLMLCAMFLFSILIGFIFYSVSKRFGICPKFIFILPCVFITHPLFAEQFNFTLQCFEVSFGLFLMFISVFLITRWIFNSKNILHLILGIIFLAWAFDSYQAVVFLYITVILSVCFFIYTNNLKNQQKEFDSKFFRKMASKYLITFCASCALYVLVSKLICLIFSLKSEYTDNMVCWGRDSFWNNVKYVLYYIKLTLTGDIFYSKAFILILVLALFYFFKFLFFKNHTNKILYVLSFLALMGSPYFLCIILARPLIPRMQFSYQFVLAFVLFFAVQQMRSQNFKEKIAKFVTFIFSLYLSFFQSYRVAGLMYTDYMKYQCEIALASKISERIDKLDIENMKDIPVAFFGRLHPTTPCEIRGEVINLSFFEADSTFVFDISNRILDFMKTIGYDYKKPTTIDCKRAKEIAKTMKSWPNSEAIRFEDGIVVIKLSDDFIE